MPEHDGIRIAVIIGTSRPGNYTSHAAALVVDELGKDERIRVDVVDPARLNLAFPGQPPTADAESLQAIVDQATGVVLATPEYHGCFAAMTKLIIENLGFPSRLRGKPVSLLGVAAGAIGAIKSLEQLRGVCSHVGAIVLPGPVSVAGVQRIFGDDGSCLDEQVEAQIRGLATAHLGYLRDHVCPRFTLERMVRTGDV